MSAFFLFTHDFVWLTTCFVPSLTPGPMGSQSLYWFWESTPTKSLHWSHWLPVTLPLRGIGGLHPDPASPETLMRQALSCPGLTHYILFCDHKCDLKIGVFAYLYVWMQYRVATSTCAYSSFRRLVLLFVSQKPLPCRFSEKCLCVAGNVLVFVLFVSCFYSMLWCCPSWEAMMPDSRMDRLNTRIRKKRFP